MLELDVTSALDAAGSAGIPEAQLDAALPRIDEVVRDLEASRGTGMEGWRDLPHDPARSSHLAVIDDLAARFRDAIDTVVVLGIGGSALGNIALEQALGPLHRNLLPADRRGGPRLFVLDNVDPRTVGGTLDVVTADDPEWERTLLVVISKSGETAETAAQQMVMVDRLKAARGDRANERVVAITDPERGTLRSLADAEGWPTLPVPPGAGGRFSVLSPVGLFTAALGGVDVPALLDGAAAMDERGSMRAGENPAALLGWLLCAHGGRGRPIHVLMPYCDRLFGLADWWRQLWAESLGKAMNRAGEVVHAGFTPVIARGATDQHSQIQLYREGPNDKVIGFLDVADPEAAVRVPGPAPATSLEYLAGSELGTLLHAERRATEHALLSSDRPCFAIRFPRVDAFHVGAFIQLWQLATAVAGRLLDVDAYDQPAVELGKQATFGLMGRDGYGEHAAAVAARFDRTSRVL